ncbi:hypothetical protein GJU39_10910 [Pedobacter petrophilus]|uniref:DUF3108 domain-containing protein n=1 Tax=Pedobacter petrophilus TaxID=1908241 RepID=A0A7K0FYR9_9SPHI|nr:hypothetical protein [Pedobacter petrophilus]MRX76601.1 hypothetical protein [Pedobacter petrophilus]
MKKISFTFLLLAAMPFLSWSQEMITPKKNLVDKKWIKNKDYQMVWTMLRDTSSMKIGIVNTKVNVSGDQIVVITEVKMNAVPSPWIDSTIVKRTDLSPVYHASYNVQRDMVLNFGKEVKGFYKDKASGKTTEIAQTVAPGYFDSNFYPMLVNWLPLKTGYKADLDIYDYNPKGKTGVIKAHILNVSEGKYPSKKLGERKVWIVEVSDEISDTPAGKSIYQIDQLTRQLYKQKIIAGNRVMEMTLVEN